MTNLLVAMWDGLLLTCPACRRGRIYRSFTQMNHRCPSCQVIFEREEGDFLGAMVVAYSLVAVLICIGVGITAFLTDLSFTTQALIWSVFTVVFLAVGYRNMKGLWLGILHVMTGLVRE